MKRYVIDLDSTIIDTSKSIINLHNKLNKDKKIQYTGKHTWSFYPMIKTKEELSELFKLFDHEDFYNDDTLVVFPYAIKIINELSMQNEVIICSKHESSRRSITSEWIYKTFPTVEIVFTNTFDKGSIIGKCDVVLDDKIESLNSFIGYADYMVCFNIYDWNRDYQGLRVNDWLEFKQFVDKLQSIDNDKLKIYNNN